MDTNLATLALRIAVHLPGWKFWQGEDTWQTYLISKNERSFKPGTGSRSIHLSIDHKSRLHIGGTWPRSEKTRQTYIARDYVAKEQNGYSSISCSIDREPSKIAADIARRFLPGYEAAYAKCLERMAQDEQNTDKQHAAADEMAKLACSTRSDQGDGNRVYIHFPGICGEVAAHYDGDTAKLEISANTHYIQVALKALAKAGAFKKK